MSSQNSVKLEDLIMIWLLRQGLKARERPGAVMVQVQLKVEKLEA
jgi:hypothetical protein